MEEKIMITVTLSREEIQERASALAQYANKLIELEEEEEDIKAGHKTRMARHKERRLEISGEIRRLSRAVRLGVEERSEQQVLFDEKRSMEEFRKRDTEAEADAKKAIELIEQQQQAAAETRIDTSLAGDFIDEAEADSEANREAVAEEERERLHREAVATWRRERPAGIEEKGEAEEDHQAEWLAGLTIEEREKYYAAPCSCGHSRDWRSEEDRDTADRACKVCSKCK